VHGNLFSLLNIVYGLVLLNVEVSRERLVSGLAIAGLLMPIGILYEIAVGLSPVIVLLGAVSTIAATALLGYELLRTR